ncbi:MAG: septum formation protein Maf [Chloroflexi bacterium]|nr:septum formation protein Maf [Chloroflexota bacterium]
MSNNALSIVLASISPRRRELISLFGFAGACQFISTDVDESVGPGESPEDLVRRLANAKAAIGAQQLPDAIIIAADTVVSIDDTILGKPVDADDAVRMLKFLRNRPHTVFSGLTVRRGMQELTQIATTIVHMRDYSDAEIASYVASGDPLDKAAAYAIQHNAFHPVARIEGCHANVMGLPLCHLYRALKAFGVAVDEPAVACQTHLNIVSPVAREILETPVDNLKSEI